MKRIEKEHRNVWSLLEQHVREDDALGLEAGGDAGRLRARERLRDNTHDNISSNAFLTASIASASDPAWRASSAIRSAALTGAATVGAASSRTALTIMPAPAVKCVPGSTRMKLPVARFCWYGSKTSGRAVETVTVPIWFSTIP